MGTTSNFNLPYPEGGEIIDANQIKDLALGADAAIGVYQTPLVHTVSLPGSWKANANVPLTFYRFGILIVFRGEIYRTSGSNDNCGTIPAAFRPSFERVRVPCVMTSAGEDVKVFQIESSGQLSVSGANNRSTTPGYGCFGVYVGNP